MGITYMPDTVPELQQLVREKQHEADCLGNDCLRYIKYNRALSEKIDRLETILGDILFIWDKWSDSDKGYYVGSEKLIKALDKAEDSYLKLKEDEKE